MTAITIFGSAKCRADSDDYQLAYELGLALGGQGWTVCNGGYSGTMEAAARGARERGAHTIGVKLEGLGGVANPHITEAIPTSKPWERQRELVARGDAYIVLKGGTGTLLELAYIAEMILKKVEPKKPILVHRPFWQPVIEVLRQEFDAPDPRFPGRQTAKVDNLLTPFDTATEATDQLRQFTS